MIVSVSAEAESDLEQIASYIAEESVESALLERAAVPCRSSRPWRYGGVRVPRAAIVSRATGVRAPPACASSQLLLTFVGGGGTAVRLAGTVTG